MPREEQGFLLRQYRVEQSDLHSFWQVQFNRCTPACTHSSPPLTVAFVLFQPLQTHDTDWSSFSGCSISKELLILSAELNMAIQKERHLATALSWLLWDLHSLPPLAEESVLLPWVHPWALYFFPHKLKLYPLVCRSLPNSRTVFVSIYIFVPAVIHSPPLLILCLNCK